MTLRYMDKGGHLKCIDAEWIEVVDFGICKASKEMFRFDADSAEAKK